MVPQGRRVRQVVSLRDVPATILDLAGTAADGRLPGVSLRRTWSASDSAPVSYAVAEVEKGRNWWGKEPARFDSLQTLVESRYQLVRTFGGVEQLFDLADTSGTRTDLAASPAGERQRAEMRGTLQRATSRPMIAMPSAARPERR
jgi:arylsulfatase A-like enzyme